MAKTRYLFFIFMVAFIFIIPSIVTHKMIIGADALFHYNRFYEAAMQIKNQNFSNFISIYGFNQSGRVVNALYGPFFAYFQGFLVLISGNWFYYQLVSNVIILLCSGYSMYGLLRYAKVTQYLSFFYSVIFMSTYGVQYWLHNQGFSAWGTSLLPLAVIPMIELFRDRHFPIKKVAVSMALLTQIHMLSALMLSLIYLIFVSTFAFKEHVGQVICPLVKSVVLYLCLTFNIWCNYLTIYTDNVIQMPFVNHRMSEFAVNKGGCYWLIHPIILLPVLFFNLKFVLSKKQNINFFITLSFATSLLFLILSTSIVPWTYLVEKRFPAVMLIQFPFRFFPPFTVLFFLSGAMALQKIRLTRRILITIGMFSLLSVGFTLQNLTSRINQWNQQSFVNIYSSITSSPTTVRSDFFDADLGKVLKEYVKATPDYLPIYDDKQTNKYLAYKHTILDEQTITKKVVYGKLELQWQGDSTKLVQLPVILYKGSQLQQDGHPIVPFSLSTIGAPTIKQKLGKNVVTVTYRTPFYVTFSIISCGFMWVVTLLSSCKHFYFRKKKNLKNIYL